MNVGQCKLISFPTFSNPDGDLSVVESNQHIPFKIKRIYYLHNIPTGAKRGVHAHQKLQQFIIAITGSFTIVIDDGTNKQTLTLNDPKKGLYVSPLIWREITEFSKGAVLMVLASEHYNPEDYFHEYSDFIQHLKSIKA